MHYSRTREGIDNLQIIKLKQSNRSESQGSWKRMARDLGNIHAQSSRNLDKKMVLIEEDEGDYQLTNHKKVKWDESCNFKLSLTELAEDA